MEFPEPASHGIIQRRAGGRGRYHCHGCHQQQRLCRLERSIQPHLWITSDYTGKRSDFPAPAHPRTIARL
jgi:hypothetical protein